LVLWHNGPTPGSAGYRGPGRRRPTTSITLAELQDIPRLGLTVIAGEAGLRRHVAWTHVSEMEDPTPWLEGGELLMSVGLAFPEDPEAQVGYINRLARRGVAGFALSVTAQWKVSDEMRREADRLTIPFFSVALETSFVEVVRTVSMANEQVSQRRLLTHVHIFDSLQARLVDGFSTRELFARIGQFTGYEIFLATNEGLELLDGVPVPPEDVVATLPSPFRQAVSIENGYVLPVVIEGEPIGHLVAVEREGSKPTGLVAVQHIATVVAFEVDRRLQVARVADAYRSATLEDILAGELGPAAIRRRLQAEGLDPDEPLVLAAVAAEGHLALDARGMERWCDQLRRAEVPHLLAGLERVYVLLPDTETAIGALAADGLPVGISRPFRLRDGHGLARREAVLALHVATRTERAVVRSGADVDHPSSLPADQESLERLVASILGPLNEYDHVHQTALVPSLRSYLEHDRSLRAAAKELFVHANSLAYRLRRIEDITGRRLASIEAQTDFWMALEAQRILSISGENGNGRTNGHSARLTRQAAR
jgi:purine catabolism regulator